MTTEQKLFASYLGIFSLFIAFAISSILYNKEINQLEKEKEILLDHHSILTQDLYNTKNHLYYWIDNYKKSHKIIDSWEGQEVESDGFKSLVVYSGPKPEWIINGTKMPEYPKPYAK